MHAISSRVLPEEVSGVSWHRVDLMDAQRVSELVAKIRPTHLLHLAWHTTPGEYWTSQENIRWVQASLSLVQQFARHAGRRVVVAGTCAEYDWRYGFCSEAVTPLNPKTLYGVCKHSLRLVVAALARQTQLTFAWGRIFFVFGPHEHPARFVPSVVRSLLRGEPARCTHGNQIRDFLFVRDVADALVALLDSSVSGPVNVASGNPVALREVAWAIGRQAGRIDLIRLGALPAPCSEPTILLGEVGRLRDEVGWYPTYDLSTGLEETVQWWKENIG